MKRRLAVLAVVGVVIVAWICFITYAAVQALDASKQGDKARTRQVRLFPASCKNYVDLFDRGVYSPADLKLALTDAPARCPEAELRLRSFSVPKP